MYSRILNQKVLGEVVAAAPVVCGLPELMAKDVVRSLSGEVEHQTYAVKMLHDGQGFFAAPLAKLLEHVSGDPSAHALGRVVRELGLLSVRRRGGYEVVWNEKQVEILKAALEVGNE